jgi:hypothetical protein
MKKLKIRITFKEELLGTASANPKLHREHVASRSKDADKIKEEMAALSAEALAEKGMTVFSKEKGKPFLWDYQVKGFLKGACGYLRRVKKSRSNKVQAYKKVIDGLIFPEPRKIMIQLPKSGKPGRCSRPLRGQTAQGERIALATSETVPAGSYIELTIVLLEPSYEKFLRELLDYGKRIGLGQWRNSGKGKFSWTEL